MSRSKWKGPYVTKRTIGKRLIVERNSEITPNQAGQTFWVHNGKVLVKLEIAASMVGHKVGEFVFTRATFIFKKKKKKKVIALNKKSC